MDEKRKKMILGVAAGAIGLLAIILIARSFLSGGTAPESAEYERIKREGGNTPPPTSTPAADDGTEAGSGRRPTQPE